MVIIGRGLTIGRPLALLLALKRPGCNAAVTVVHTGVPDLGRATCAAADVVVAAAGSAGLVTPDMVKPGAAVVGGGHVAGRAASSCPTSTRPWPRWPAGSPPGSAGWAP